MALSAQLFSAIQGWWAVLLSVLIVFYFLRNRYQKGLSYVPGPWLNSISTLPRMVSVYRGKHHLDDLELHRRYGKVVRLAPNLVSVSDTDEINTIYGIKTKFYKAPFYDLSSIYDDQGLVPDPFVIRQDKALHARMKRNAANAYSMDGLMQFEPWVDEVLDRLLFILDDHALHRTTCDLGKLLKMFAMDGVTRLSFGSDFGYMERGDHHRIFPTTDLFTAYMSIVCSVHGSCAR